MTNPGQLAPRGEDWIGRELQTLRRDITELRAANPFATMGIIPKSGGIDVQGFINSLRPDGTVGVSMDDDGVFLVYDAAGTTPVARFGPLESAAGEYGVEVLVGSTWVQLGAQSTTWDMVSGKPVDFAPLVTSAVANATNAANATEAVHAAQADGSEYGWTNNVAGTSFYALWVGNDGGFHLGRNVSSIKYKENVSDAVLDPSAVLNLRPVHYDRKPTLKYPEDPVTGERLEGPAQKFEGAKNEFGLIAEEVNEHLPDIVTRYGGEIDGVRYDLLGVALLPVVQQQAEDIAALKQAVRDLGGTI